jgi:hypothetical protein
MAMHRATSSARHFDMHFHLTTEAARREIDPTDPRFMEKAANRPGRDLMPPNFVPSPTVDPIPAMGEQRLDATDPVFAGKRYGERFHRYRAAVPYVLPRPTPPEDRFHAQ